MATTYALLQTRIQDTMENDGSEFIAAIPNFISAAELRLTRELDSNGFSQYITGNFTAADAFFVLPSNNLVVNSLNWTNTVGSRIALLLRSKEFIEDYWPVRSSVGNPKYYAKFRNDKVLIAPTPTSAWAVELDYVVQPSALTTVTQPTNYFTDFCENALFYACMVEACLFTKNPSAVQVWEAQYQRETMSLVNEARRNRRDDMEQTASPSGSGNTLIDNAR
jgi:hypothetical protein